LVDGDALRGGLVLHRRLRRLGRRQLRRECDVHDQRVLTIIERPGSKAAAKCSIQRDGTAVDATVATAAARVLQL
jgi:hypothetical protein